MKKTLLLLFFNIISFNIYPQDSTLIGRFSIGISGIYSKSNLADEQAKGGGCVQFRFFPRDKSAFTISYQNIRSSVERLGKISTGINSSLGIGLERHFPISNFSPYLGLELGLNITKVKSELIKLPSNNEFFQNNLPNYLFKPKVGFLYNVTENIFVNFEGTFNWVISADRDNTNPLFDDSYTAIYFGRKVPTVSIGIHYLFDE
jgi:hypothetical protein